MRLYISVDQITMMKNNLIPVRILSFAGSVFLFLTLNISGSAQVSTPNESGLEIRFTVTHNSRDNNSQPLADFVLTNTGKRPFASKGWKIYYNSKTILTPTQKNSGLNMQQLKASL